MNFEKFKKIFDSEEKCINLLIENNYIQNTRCYYCNNEKIYKKSNYNYACKKCKKWFSIFKNTLFMNSSTSIVLWFYVIYIIINSKKLNKVEIQKETQKNFNTTRDVIKKINKAFKDIEIKNKFNFLLEENININNTATESDKNFLYYDLYSRLVHQYVLLKYVKDNFAINKKYNLEYDFFDKKVKNGLESMYFFLDTIVSDLDSFFRKNFSFIDKIEAFYRFKNKEYLKLNLFDEYVSYCIAEQYRSDIYIKEYEQRDEIKTYDPENLVTDLENCKNDTDEESQKEYLRFQEIINEAKKIINIK